MTPSERLQLLAGRFGLAFPIEAAELRSIACEVLKIELFRSAILAENAEESLNDIVFVGWMN